MKSARIARVLTLVLVTALFVPASMTYISGKDNGSSLNDAIYVRIGIRGTESNILAPYNVDIVETYDGYVLARVDASQMNALRALNIDVEEVADLFQIDLKASVFDVRNGEPAIPADLKITSYPADTEGYYMVQFIGPVKQEWLWQLEANGVEALRYVPNYAFLVRATPESLESARALRQVTWTGQYHPAYKIDPLLNARQGIVPVEIITFPDTPLNAVVAFLNKHGYGGTDFTGAGPGIVSYYQASEWGVVRARVEASFIPEIAKLSHVEFIEQYNQPEPFNYNSQAVHQTNATDPTLASARRIWNLGLRGQGQIIAVADTGVDYDHNMFRQSDTQIAIGDIYNVTDLNRRKVIRYMTMSNYTNVNPLTDQWAWKDSSQWTGPCTSGHGTATTGIAVGNDDGIGSSDYDGMAKEAKLFFEDIGTVRNTTACNNQLDDVLQYIPDDLNLLFGPAYSNGSRIHSNSWGGGTVATYGLSSLQIDQFMWKHPDMLVVFAEGNGGPTLSTVSEQPSAKNSLAAGGSFNFPSQNTMTTYNGWGPTADGRQRPTAAFVSEGETSWSDGSPWSNNMRSAEWLTFGGTSYAAPNAAGHATLMRQYFTDGWYPTGAPHVNNTHNPQASLLNAMLAAAGAQITGQRTNPPAENRFPNDAIGWGLPILDNSMYFQGDTRFLKVVDDKSGLKTGQWEEYQYRVTNSSQILKFILAWTDYPGAVGVGKALVNDLDVLVTSPTGDTYKGNVWENFKSGQSRKNFGGYDRLNNIEGAIVKNPAIGTWTVRVTAFDVPAGPQPYSLVTVGGIDPGYGQVFLDRHTYAPDCYDGDMINITVVDIGASGQVTVNVTSDTEPWPLEVTLTETGSGSGVFKAPVRTAFGTPTVNSTIEVSEGDKVWVMYSDLSPTHDAVAHADIESAKPTIYDVRVSGLTSSTATITWLTNKPVDSYVYYGTSSPPTNLRYTRELRVSHSLTLVNLQTATLYFFDVASSDGRGHKTLDTNGGRHYAFKTTAKGEILLVLGDETYEGKRPEGLVGYRQSLANRGWSFNEWHVAFSGDPSLALMQTYKAVIWQVGLEQYPPHTDAEMTLLSQYLNEGGRLFYVHHDTFWAYCAPSGSSWSKPADCSWAKGMLKASFNTGNPNQGDPSLISGIVGETGDPISGDYASGGPQFPTSYIPFRSGGSADEVTPLVAGGATTPVWSDSGVDANPDKIAVKWISSVNNGTLGVGVWGGYRSRMVGLYANWIDIDYLPGMPFSLKRTDILDKTIIWLIERDHPDVQVQSPNGGETITTDSVTISWTSTTYGANVFSQSAYYSFDAGQSWFPIALNIPAINVTHPWYLSGVCNGNNYLVRVEVQDDGTITTPKFSASDDSDGIFTVDRIGGDCGGPRLWAGSGTIEPTPIMGPVPVYVNATADDTTTGNSNIHATRPAEFFIDVTGPNGTGWGMNLTSPPTSPVEGVSWTGTLDWLAKKCHVMFFHAQDEWGYWGPWENTTFCVQDIPPTRPPNPPRNPNAELVNGANDVNITWTLSTSDPAELNHYEVWYSTNVYDRNKGPSYVWLGDSPAGQGFFVHTGVGRNANSYFYYVRAVNAGGYAGTTEQVAKFARDLTVGKHLISVPVVAINTDISSLLQTLAYDSVRWYNNLDAADPWESYKPGRTYNDLTSATTAMGLWVDLTAAGVFAVAGKVPASTVIGLKAGWNLVGLPSFMPYNVGDLKVALPGLLVAVEAYNATAGPYFLMRVTSDNSFALSAGNGFWIQVTSVTNWVLQN